MDEKKWNEGAEAGRHRDMGIKTVAGQDSEGHIRGSKQSEFNERSAQQRERRQEAEDGGRTDIREEGTDGIQP
ncbi:hypothetical protein [Flaviaesturariibacter amylovorans]|uniref:General stress protein n=1 Tax=Flaviaesturariibacter amylovorans TaxID=1084520 RepID=A0ABP8HB80_9BACT